MRLWTHTQSWNMHQNQTRPPQRERESRAEEEKIWSVTLSLTRLEYNKQLGEASRRIKDSSLKEAKSLPPPTWPSLPPPARQGTQAQLQHPAWAQVCVLGSHVPARLGFQPCELPWVKLELFKEYSSAKKVLLMLSEMLWQDTCAVLIKIQLPTYVVSGVHGKTMWTARKQSIPGKKQ